MKTLPDNPDLDHLRRQAKDLLAGLRDSDPTVPLAAAQASLARQYGFRTWTALKAEVDRLRGRVDVADPVLAQRIAVLFGLGEVTGPLRSVSRPDEVGRRWALDTDRGRWSPRTVDDVYPVTDGEADTRFQEAAARAGVTLPAPVRSTAGRVVEEIDGHRWRVHRWVNSGPPLAAPVSAAVTREVGEVLAALHGLRLPVDGICPWNARPLSSTSWEDLAALAASKGAAWAGLLAAAVPALAELDSFDDEPTSEPVLCHNNITPGNVRVGAGGRLVVVGWEHASGLPPEWEVAAALVTWAVDPAGGVNAAGARALLDGYRARAGELPSLSLGTFRGSATGLRNYVSGQVHAALAAEGVEERRFADRTIRHLLAHLPSKATYRELARR